VYAGGLRLKAPWQAPGIERRPETLQGQTSRYATEPAP